VTRVLFVSKPVVPPWNDGSKNLVRDVATHLTRAEPSVLTCPGSSPLEGATGKRVNEERVYASSGRFAPALTANLRVLGRLLSGDAHDIWHFVSAPHRLGASAARLARNARRATGWRGHVVQTIASAPRRFAEMPRLLFGDVVVVLSEWMRARVVGSGAPSARLRVIPPCAKAPPQPSAEEMLRVRQRYAIGQGPIVLYPGDYETGTGAMTVARAVGSFLRSVRDVTFVYACRAKTAASAPAREEVVSATKDPELAARVVHVGEVDDLFALLGAASAVAFPVDDLFGKVDVPLVVLEALALGVPLVLAGGGPLESVESARFVTGGDAASLAHELVTLLTRRAEARELAERGRLEYERRFSPRVVAEQYDELYEELGGIIPARSSRPAGSS
jgi:glycosyltransferase involved in cell wall biosynthesis